MRRQLLSICREYDRPADAMWAVVADLDGYAEHVGALAATPVLHGSGVGAVRQCVTTSDQRWQETVTAWEEGRSYEIEVDTSTYPFLLRSIFRRFTGIWRVEPAGERRSRVCMAFIADVRGGRAVWPLVRLAARGTRRDLEATLVSYGAWFQDECPVTEDRRRIPTNRAPVARRVERSAAVRRDRGATPPAAYGARNCRRDSSGRTLESGA